MCYVAGIDKGDGTRTNQRTFRSGSNKYPRGEVCEQRLQRETPIVFRPSSLPTILPPPMEASSSSSSLIEIYARWDHANSTRLESPYTNSCPNFRGVTRPLHPWEYSAKLPLPAPSTDDHRQMFLDWIRFSYLSLSLPLWLHSREERFVLCICRAIFSFEFPRSRRGIGRRKMRWIALRGGLV